MSVDIDFFTLGRLTEKAFKFDTSDKAEYISKISAILSSSKNPVEDIVKFIEQELLSRKIIFAASTADPKTALKPKGMMFRRAGADEPAPATVLLPTEITAEELDRRLQKAREASRNLAIMGIVDDDDDDDSGNDEDIDDIEDLMKSQVLNSNSLAGKLEDEE
jgi:hypothetical protein